MKTLLHWSPYPLPGLLPGQEGPSNRGRARNVSDWPASTDVITPANGVNACGAGGYQHWVGAVNGSVSSSNRARSFGGTQNSK